MERLLKHTPEGNDDLILLPEVISKLDEQIKKLNDSIAAAEFQSIVSTLTFKNQTENNIPFGATQLFYKGNVKCKSDSPITRTENVKLIFKGSSDPSHFIFEINVGKIRIRQKTTEDGVVQI